MIVVVFHFNATGTDIFYLGYFKHAVIIFDLANRATLVAIPSVHYMITAAHYMFTAVQIYPQLTTLSSIQYTFTTHYMFTTIHSEYNLACAVTME